MHGLIANQLRSYTIASHGRNVWSDAVHATGSKIPVGYVPLDRAYPDEDVVALIVGLAQSTKTEVPVLLEDFGAFLAGALLRVYQPLIMPDWRTLDVVEGVEEHVHTAIRMRDPTAGPPYLSATRVSPTAVDVVYTSPRRLCPLGEGIVRGLATHFGESVGVTQPECMLRGDPRCVIAVKLLPA